MPAAPLVLLEDVRHIEITDRLGEPAVLTLDVFPHRPVAFAPSDGGGLALRQTVAVAVPDGRVGPVTGPGGLSEWRIASVDRTYGGENGQMASCTVTCRPLWEDLDEAIAYRLLEAGPMTGHPVFDIVATGVSPQEMLQEILSLHPVLETPFVAGTVPAAVAAQLVTIEATRASKLDLIKGLLAQLRKPDGSAYEWEATWDGTAYRIDIVEEVGWTAAERAAGQADPLLRPVEAPTAFYTRLFGQPDSLANRIRLREEVSGEGLFTALVATGGKDGETIVGDSRWYITAASGSTFTLVAVGGGGYGPVYVDGCLDGLLGYLSRRARQRPRGADHGQYLPGPDHGHRRHVVSLHRRGRRLLHREPGRLRIRHACTADAPRPHAARGGDRLRQRRAHRALPRRRALSQHSDAARPRRLTSDHRRLLPVGDAKRRGRHAPLAARLGDRTPQ